MERSYLSHGVVSGEAMGLLWTIFELPKKTSGLGVLAVDDVEWDLGVL